MREPSLLLGELEAEEGDEEGAEEGEEPAEGGVAEVMGAVADAGELDGEPIEGACAEDEVPDPRLVLDLLGTFIVD